jgi:2-dehydro-3-deoxyphosphogluconate aldolase / (4S)-4-hydroxy-2-oxoglutarate aldolase
MARFDRLTVYNALLQSGLMPLFYHGDVGAAAEIAAACASGGARLLEFTNRGEKALPVFTRLKEQVEKDSPQLILGVGSVVEPYTAALFIAHGANFVVGPTFNPEIARLCNRRKIAYIPGCGTVNEISAAEESGAEIVKVFPGNAEFIKAVLGPMPWSRLLPTGGVDATPESIQSWIKAGAAAVGLGSNLVRKDWVEACNYQAIQEAVQQVLGWIGEARGKA